VQMRWIVERERAAVMSAFRGPDIRRCAMAR
jgi:hypothetical protein